MPSRDDPGVYRITVRCGALTRFYIGRAMCLAKREKEHFKHLLKRKHANPFLQRAWDKYGQSAFSFSIIRRCDKDHLAEIEQQEIDQAIAVYGRSKIFNILLDRANTRLNVAHKKQTREKISRKMKELWSNPEYRNTQLERILAGHLTPQARKNNSEAQKLAQNREDLRMQKAEFARSQGLDLVTKAKRSETNARPEVRLKRSVAVKAALATPEGREGIQRRASDPVILARISEGVRRAFSTEEARRKRSEIGKIVQNRPEIKERNRIAQLARWARIREASSS